MSQGPWNAEQEPLLAMYTEPENDGEQVKTSGWQRCPKCGNSRVWYINGRARIRRVAGRNVATRNGRKVEMARYILKERRKHEEEGNVWLALCLVYRTNSDFAYKNLRARKFLCSSRAGVNDKDNGWSVGHTAAAANREAIRVGYGENRSKVNLPRGADTPRMYLYRNMAGR